MTASLRPDDDPLALFQRWYAEAAASGLSEPTAMAVATASASGRPSVRMMLLKGVDDQGFVFYTNLGSHKAADLAENPQAALCFYWMPLKRQVRVEGPVERVGDEEADAYFASRPRKSRIGAWASKQSQPLQGRFELEQRIARFAARDIGKGLPRPPFWSGFRLSPESIEFWVEQPFRLHERMVFRRDAGGWRAQSLYP